MSRDGLTEQDRDDAAGRALSRPDLILTRLEARFEKLRLGLLAEHEGRWALLFYRGAKRVPLLEIRDDERDAVRAGHADPEMRRFCVKQIVEHDEVLTAYSLGATQ
ncbi:MAG: hypothetical protein OXH86_14960 [Acidimicrobiaceae bacterium]|nr:hypothetical protein [Acidimicrobiaceae bacterium]MDE0498646.1 hypothetical protein [Acidimicrobiaceae bacterium]